ncbi:unnamed protein product [Lactuca virosa]|uniref:Uncharacterized protein n=1 Tax=Lactuca virosa TaxID=75947 RepID=A0AAU9N5J0_9ASTR|nr:unnamed protein product [Lactuca virosa]
MFIVFRTSHDTVSPLLTFPGHEQSFDLDEGHEVYEFLNIEEWVDSVNSFGFNGGFPQVLAYVWVSWLIHRMRSKKACIYSLTNNNPTENRCVCHVR